MKEGDLVTHDTNEPRNQPLYHQPVTDNIWIGVHGYNFAISKGQQ